MTAGVPKISVIYLSYIPFGISHLADFVNSYNMFEAGCPHSLVIVFKGMINQDQVIPYLNLLEQSRVNFSTLYYAGDGIDLDAYFWAAGQLEDQHLYFLNTNSILRADNWLEYYVHNFSDCTGMISATASYQSYYSTVFGNNKMAWEFKNDFMVNFRKYKLFLKALLFWRFHFKPFPNPHIRTNAFMVRKKDFLESYRGPVNTKFNAYRYESGRNSITSYFLKKGLKVLVVDKYGRTYGPEQWAASSTFRIRQQENLLVADNQTRIYELADEENKRSMTKLSWGDQ